MDILGFALAAVGVTSIIAAFQSRREREHRYDTAALAITGVGLGVSAVVIGA